MAVRLNVANSIVDYLRSQNQPYDFTSRKSLYEKQGLQNTFGGFQGSAAQNTALLQQLQKGQQSPAPANQAAPSSAQAQPVNSVPSIAADEARLQALARGEQAASASPYTASGQPEVVQGEIVDQQVFDPLQTAISRRREAISRAGEQYAPELTDITEQFAGQFARGAQQIGQDVAGAKAAGAAQTEVERRRGIAERLARESQLAQRGLTSSGIAQSELGQVQTATAGRQAQVEAKTAGDILQTLQDAESQYGTEFLRSLGIPEATDFLASLPAPVRGVLERQFAKEREGVQTKILSEANRIETEARRLEQDVEQMGEKASQSEERLLNMRLKIPAGETFEFGGKTYEGMKDDDPDIQVIREEDNKGNVTVIGLDKRTGEELYKQSFSGIGKATKAASGGGNSSGGTRIGGSGSNLTFTPTEKRTLARANIVDPDAGAFFLETPSAFQTWFMTNMVPGGYPSSRENIKENFDNWAKKGGGSFEKGKEVLYETETRTYFTDGTSEQK